MKAASLALVLFFLLAGCGSSGPENVTDRAATADSDHVAVAATLGDSGDKGGIVAAYRPKSIPYSPDDGAWKKIPETTVPLFSQIITVPNGGGSIAEIKVRAVHNGEDLAIRLEWEDETADREVGTSTFRDAVAVGFPARQSDTLPSPFMGDPKHPVNIWQWTADFDANARGQSGFAERYPHTEGVWIFPQDPGITRQVRYWRGTEPVIELTASGFGSLERHESQAVYGTSRHKKGRWTVVLRRQLSTGNPEDTHFRSGSETHIVLAVWEGTKQEVNGKKSITMSWIPLELEPTLKTASGGSQ